MSIDTATAAKVAKLARIRVEEAALPALAQEFNNILGFIEQDPQVQNGASHRLLATIPLRVSSRGTASVTIKERRPCTPDWDFYEPLRGKRIRALGPVEYKSRLQGSQNYLSVFQSTRDRKLRTIDMR